MKIKLTCGPSSVGNRPSVRGKFLFVDKEKFYVKGVTYGTFAPGENGLQFPPKEVVEKDFALMAEHGFNSVRTYTVPPGYLLDLALQFNLKVMAGLPWEQHITFLDTKKQRLDIIRRVKEGVQSCKQHPAILCFTIGNEIPAPIVRWYGKEKIEGFLKQLYETVKEADPQSLVTYVNYPTTEYLDLSFLDFDCFNVYLETPEKLSSYIARLHNLCGDRPLVLAEIGLDSMRNGEDQQARVLRWQIETIYGKGCAGMFVFAWTDEWWRGGFEIEDWDFGIVNRQRAPKSALYAVSNAMENIPLPRHIDLPFISVIVCSYNGSATIRDTLEGLQKLNYPGFEVIVVNDGSTDNLEAIVKEYPVQLITTVNCGLSSARNTGMYNAIGEIVAYIDDDAYPDPQWLHYLAYAYRHSSHACIGGPNIAPDEDGYIATCVANAPGGPVHVLLCDEVAEHVPGCNMSFKKEALLKIGGFDPIYRSAGDDVDACWRIQQNGGTVGFHPSAVVWHHRRNSIKAYWKQQKGYGKAEALLEVKWPEKYNGFGHLAWAGRIYGSGFTIPLKLKKDKVFYGTWGSALFQSVYEPGSGLINVLPLMPEWYFVIFLLGAISSLGLFWTPLLWTLVLFAASLIVVLAQAVMSAFKNTALPTHKRTGAFYLLIIALHIIQPIARLYGRLKHGLTPWRKRGNKLSRQFLFIRRNHVFTYWSETWLPIEDWLSAIEQKLIDSNTRVQKGNVFDRWDLQLRNGIISLNRALLTIEEHGAGKQFVRLKTWCRPSRTSLTLLIASTALSITAGLHNATFVCMMLALFSFIIVAEYVLDTAILLHKLESAFKKAAPVQAQVVQPAGEPLEVHEASCILNAQQEEVLYATASNFRENGRIKLVRPENEIITSESTQ